VKAGTVQEALVVAGMLPDEKSSTANVIGRCEAQQQAIAIHASAGLPTERNQTEGTLAHAASTVVQTHAHRRSTVTPGVAVQHPPRDLLSTSLRRKAALR
jgi:hypothetical protein